MTRLRNDGNDTPFGRWLRNHPSLDSRDGYDAQNIDYVWHHYRDGKIMLIEEKTYHATSSKAQKDTHSIMHQALRYACTHMEFTRPHAAPNRPTRIQFYGYHIITFEQTHPQDGAIFLNDERITESELLAFLQFRSPLAQPAQFKEPLRITIKAQRNTWPIDIHLHVSIDQIHIVLARLYEHGYTPQSIENGSQS